MTTKRREIRKYVVSLLKRKRTDAEDRVTGNRSLPAWEEHLPVINVYTRGEDLTEWAQAPREMLRNLRLVCECIVSGKTEEEVADALDTMTEDVEAIMSQDDTLGDRCEDILLTDVEFEWQEGGERPLASARLIWNCKYMTPMPRDRKGLGITPFEGIDAEWDVGTAADPDPEAEDTIDLPQT